MTKRIFLISLLALFTTTLFAVPAKRGVYKTIKLADGTELRVELRGDEHVSYWIADDGRCFNRVDEADYYEQVDVNQMVRSYEATRLTPEKAITPSARGRLAGNRPSSPVVGERKGLIILVQFADLQFQEGHDVDFYSKIVNQRGYTDEYFVGSVRDYFYDQSDGLLDYTFDIVGPVTLPQNYAYYGGNTVVAGGKDSQKNMKSFVTSSLNAVKADIDFSTYDNDGDGEVDNVFFIYAGYGEADSDDEDAIWPHMYYLYDGYRVYFRQNGVRVNVYACANEIQGIGIVNGIGSICHEFSHCLGLPDMYDTGSVGNYGSAYWDIMHAGNYLGKNFRPCGYTAYEREFLRWREIKELTSDCDITEKGISDGGSAYRIYNPANDDEYFILEPRSLSGWDANLYNSGLLIYHVDYNYMAWVSNTVNNEKNHQRCAIVAADNDYTESPTSFKNDAYPYSTNAAFSDTTTPASTLFNANTDGTKNLGKSVYDIKRNADGTFSFSFMNGVWRFDNNAPEGSLFYESFVRCDGAGGNDGVFSGSVGTSTFVPDNEGWTGGNRFGGLECAKFGTNKQNGKATTPEITIDGEAVLTFKAAPYASECGGIILSLSDANFTLADTKFPITAGKWTECKTTITGTGTVKVVFQGTKRWFLDEVLVMPPGEGLVGDANEDGNVTMADANLIVNAYLGTIADGFNSVLADVNSDGNITMADANGVVNIYVGGNE